MRSSSGKSMRVAGFSVMRTRSAERVSGFLDNLYAGTAYHGADFAGRVGGGHQAIVLPDSIKRLVANLGHP